MNINYNKKDNKSDLDVPNLLKALEDDRNEVLFNFTSKSLRELNFNVLRELGLSKEELKDFMKKLGQYKYIDEMKDLKYGSFIRWIPLNDPDNIELKKGGILSEVKITDKGVAIICKGFGYFKNYFQFLMDECLIFQKLSEQELVLLNVLDHVS
jgi:hypothetical protein